MYGGGFATVPAYLSDLFGTKMVGAIHGRLLTAWSVAGVLGPFLVGATSARPSLSRCAEAAGVQHHHVRAGGAPRARLRLQPADPPGRGEERHDTRAARTAGCRGGRGGVGGSPLAGAAPQPSPAWLVAAAWLAVGIPLVWGVWMTLQKAAHWSSAVARGRYPRASPSPTAAGLYVGSARPSGCPASQTRRTWP